MSDDAQMAKIARKLARHLIEYAYDRRDEDKKKIAELHTELCAKFREELARDNPEQPPIQ